MGVGAVHQLVVREVGGEEAAERITGAAASFLHVTAVVASKPRLLINMSRRCALVGSAIAPPPLRARMLPKRSAHSVGEVAHMKLSR